MKTTDKAVTGEGIAPRVNDPNANYAMYELDRVAKREAETIDKRNYYQSAIALIGCAKFRAGDCVSVAYYGQNVNGVHYFLANGVAYPEHHLTRFVM